MRRCICGERFFFRFSFRQHLRKCERIRNPASGAEAAEAVVLQLLARGFAVTSRYGDERQTLKVLRGGRP